MTKAEFIKKFSKIENTFEDEFRAEYNSPELIWEALKEQLLIHSVVLQSEQLCEGCNELKKETISFCKECYLKEFEP